MKYRLFKVFYVVDMPPEMSIRFCEIYGNDVNEYVAYCVGDEDDVEINDWLLANGADQSERVLVFI